MGATFRAQANALFRKNAVYQKRAVCFNVCLLSAPIVFCSLLFIMQTLINNLLLSGDDFKCGCKCLECCMPKQSGNCYTPKTNETTECTSPYKCTKRSKTECGFAYSTFQQATWCPIKNPDVYPPLVQLQPDYSRAKDWRPNTPFFTTAKDPAVAAALGSNIAPVPDIVRLSAEALNFKFNPNEILVDSPLRADVLADMGLTLATAHETQRNYYKDQAFVNQTIPIEVLVPSSFCKDNNLTVPVQSDGTRNISYLSLSDFVTATLALQSKTLTAAEKKEVNANLAKLSAGSSTEGGSSGSSLQYLQVVCTDVSTVNKKTVSEIDDVVYCGWWESRCGGRPALSSYSLGFDFKSSGKSKFDVDVVYNDSSRLVDAQAGAPSNMERINAPVNLAVSSWMKYALGDKYRAELTGLASTPKSESKLALDFSSLLGPLFYCWVMQMLLPTFLVQLVYEKEKRLRMMMKMHGLTDAAYWAVTYLWYITLYIAYTIIYLVFGSVIGLKIFTKNNYGIQVIFYFLFANCNIAFAFLLSCFFSNSRTAVVVAFLYVFGTGLIGYLLLAQFMAKNYSWMFFVEWVPAFSLYRGLFELSEYSFLGVFRNGDGMLFENLGDNKNAMARTWLIFLVEWVVFMLLAWYLEQVYASGTGVRRHPLFFLERFTKKKSDSRSGAATDAKHVEVDVGKELADVVEERNRVAALNSYDDHPIVVKDLQKVYPSQDGLPPKVAVRSLSLAVEKGECFGLLGPNGAGKSTSINMMTGFLEPTGGRAIVAGKDISSDMSEVYKIMGVCPQHDLLWDTLTGREHLLFYGRLKGLVGTELTTAVDSGLKSVNLFNNKVGEKMSKQYSGGMKRRLSVGISFIGSPKVVYLDEPSTGLDPASRRNLWDVVRSSKQGRGIVLTTHSMEEAEILCDRLGIFVDGQLVCIGNPKEITSRYGDYYVFSIQVPPEQDAAARELVAKLSPSGKITYAVGGALKFELPKKDLSLSTVFQTMTTVQANKSLTVLDWGVANATLEEVFIKFARQIGAQAGDMGH